MKFQDLKSAFKNIIDTCVDFVVKNKRYFLGGLVFIIMMVVLFKFTDADSAGTSSTKGVYADYKENTNSELETLITTYYTAYAEGDTDTIASIATPVSDQEISYISFYSQYIESYNDIQIFTKQGLDSNSYIVSTVVNLKYTDIDTAAPGMDFFYVQTNEDGELYINNLYGNFNQLNNIYEMDTEVTDLIALFLQQGDVLAKEAEVQAAYDEAVASDENLSTFLNDTLSAAILQWNLDYQAEVEAAEAAAAEEEEAAASEEETETDTADEETSTETETEETTTYTGTTNARANVRAEASADSDKLGSLDSGVSITIYGEEGDFYKFDYDGTTAYITVDAVDVDSDDSSDSDDSDSTSTATFEEGDEITLTSTVNIRSSMDSSSSKVAVAYAGETVTVVMSYAEGWTKVEYDGETGYIRSDLLEE